MYSPLQINNFVEKLLTKIGSEYEPEIIMAQPEKFARAKDCFNNVRKKVAQDGGKLVHGWAIWQGNILCEGEFHAVWEDNNGYLRDITPHETKITQLLFVPDDRYTYDGNKRDNIRLNITTNPVVDHFISIAETLFFTEQYGEKIDEYHSAYPAAIVTYRSNLEKLKHSLNAYLNNGGKMGTTCFCNSFRKYSSCHGKNFYENLNSLKRKIENEMKQLSDDNI